MYCFIQPSLTLSLTRSNASRQTVRAASSNQPPYSRQLFSSSTVSSLYDPPNPHRPHVDPHRDGGPPHDGNNRYRRDDDDGGHNSPTFGPLSILINLFRKYNSLLQSAPLTTKSISACFLVFLSDLVAQALTKDPTDFLRLGRYALYGLLVAGPQGHYWFQFLESVVRMRGLPGIAIKVFADQLLYLPLVTAGFFYIMKIAEGESIRKSFDFTQDTLPETVLQAWKIWPFATGFNFAMVPVQLRVIFTSTISVFWVAFLSVVANDQPDEEKSRAASS